MTLLTPLFSYLVLGLMPHGYCYLWQTPLVGLHLVSDGMIALAYYSIPLTLVYFVQKRHNFPYNWVFLLFGMFIVSCGTTHLMAIWTLWHPDYWVSGIIKAITAISSIYTAIVLIPLLPKILALPSTEALEEEIKQRQTVEKALRTSQRRLESILDMAEEAIISLNAKQEITLFNRGAEKIFGWNASDIIGKSLNCLLPQRFIVSHQQYVNQFQQSSDITRKMGKKREIFGLRQDQTEFLAEASIAKLDLSEETIVTVFLRDISDRRQREQAIYEHQQRFRKVFEDGPLGMAIVGLDYRFIDVNHTLCQMLGYLASELLELTFVDVTHPDDIDKDVNLAQQLYQQEIPSYSLEKRYVTKQGQILWVMLTAALLKDEQGQPRYGFAMIEDISDRKVAEAKLQQYKRIISAASDGIVLLDRNYNYQLVNQSYLDLHQKTDTEVIGHSVVEILGKTVFETKVKPYIDRSFSGISQEFQNWFELPGLGKQFISANFVPYFENNKTISGVVISLRNITHLKQIEESLRENKLKFRQLIDNVKDVLYIHDAQTYQVLYISPAFEDLWGISCETVYKNPYAWINCIHPDDRQRVRIAFENRISQGQYNEEYRIIRPNGEIRWIWSRSYPVFDELGNIYRVAGIAEDITERKAIQQTLELQDVIVKNMAEGVCLVSADTGELVYANPKFERMFGYEIGELKGQHVSIVNYEDERKSAEDVNQEIRHNVLEKGEYTYEVYNVKKDGTAFWCRATTSCFNHPEYGKVLVAVQEDINENKKIEAALKNSEQRLQYLIRSSPVVIFGCQPYDDFPATYISENVTNLLGYKPEDFLKDSKFWVDRVHPDDRERILSNLSQLFEQDFYNHEYRFLHADGNYRWLLAQLRLIRDEKGNPRESLGYLVDISDRKQAENKLTTSLEEKEVLLREIHHRVKNNLQVICSLLNLQARSVEDTQIKELLRESQNRVRAMSLVHEKLYRSENIASINLADYLQDLAKNIANAYKNVTTKINLKTDINPMIFLTIDIAVPCGLIINELISNAYKYAFAPGTQGEITLQAMMNNEQSIILTVKDNGKGLPKDFDLDQVKTLGLQLVKTLTNQLRGQIILGNKQGTHFKITLTRINP
ncbi:two-component sensor histidine kinase [Crocosphaera subtropica ATCC 51142]|uniref:histidine kinase n=1 Tax=Crocosphaera subtropica (strain ATCC 51142 / BH68) TaxID=43989 RepID=B1X0D9_CROS5|nr:PAS domain S-box protein [Crocosphaera subtropica]ACB51228.1 two-component sensor histidine kinase [Crocosphaera subtropica ATCC 51142]